MSIGYDPFYWYEREIDREFEENIKEIERELENDKKGINSKRRNATNNADGKG